MRIVPLGYFFDARSVPTAVEPAYQKEQLEFGEGFFLGAAAGGKVPQGARVRVRLVARASSGGAG